MIRRNTWVLLSIFVILVGVAWYTQKNKSGKSAEATPTSSVKTLFTPIDEKAIANVRIQDKQGKVLVLGRDSSGLWTVSEPKGGPGDAGKIESGISALISMTTKSSLNPTNDLNIYGLTTASYAIFINMNGGQKYTLTVGDVTPTGDGYYVRVGQSPPQVVDKYSLDAVLDMLKNPPYKPTETPTTSPTSSMPGVTGTITATVTAQP